MSLRKSLIRLASSQPPGSPERSALLSVLTAGSKKSPDFPRYTIQQVYEMMSGNTVEDGVVLDSGGRRVDRYSDRMAEGYIDIVLETDPDWSPPR